MTLNPGPASSSTANLVAQLIASGQLTETSQAVFYPASTTTQDIINAANAAAVTGGLVQLPPGIITLTQSLPLLSGVVYRGAGYGYSTTGWPAPANPTNQGAFGTVLVAGGSAAGTFPAFWDGRGPRGVAYASAALMTAQYLVGCGVRGLQVVNFSHGIKVGDLQEASCAWSTFDNVSAVGCGWGFWFENADSSRFKMLVSANYSNGSHWHISSTPLINLGDSVCEQFIFNNPAGGLGTNFTRNIVFGSRNGSNQNSICLTYAGGVTSQGTEFNNTVSLPSSGSSIQLTSGNTNQYVAGMPVSFSVTTGSTPALNAQQIYFVKTITDSTHLTLSNNYGGAAITFSGSGTGTMYARGFPAIEIVAQDATSTISGMTTRGIGADSIGAMAYLVQGLQGSGGFCSIELCEGLTAAVGVPGTGGITHYQNVVARNNGGVHMTLAASANSVDFDSGMQYCTVYGFMAANYQQGYTGCGVLANFNNASGPAGNGLFIGGLNTGFAKAPLPDLIKSGTTGVIGIGQTIFGTSGAASASAVSAQGAGTWNATHGNAVSFTSASSTAYTIPVASTPLWGTPIRLNNQGAGTVTVSLASGNFSGVTTGTSFTLVGANTSALIECVETSGAGAGWYRYL